MTRTEAEKILKQAIKESYLDKPKGRLYLKLIGENVDKYYFELYDLPDDA